MAHGAYCVQPLDSTTYMLHIAIMTANEVMGILKKNGWKLERISGSHHVFDKDGCRPITVPFHGSVDLGILGKRILKQAGIK